MSQTEMQDNTLKLLGKTSQKYINQSIQSQDLINRNVKSLTKNLKTYCSLLIKKGQEEKVKEIKKIIKSQLRELQNDECCTQFEVVEHCPSEIEGYLCFINLNGFESIILQLLKFRMEPQDSSTYHKISLMIKQFLQEMGAIIQSDHQVIEKLQIYDVYANKIINQDSQDEDIDKNRNSQTIQKYEKHIQQIKIGQLRQDAFNYIYPPLHRSFIYEASRAYHNISAFKIRNIINSKFKTQEEKITINVKNYFNCEEDKMIICYPKAKTKAIGYYQINEIEKDLTITTERYKERYFSMKWDFSINTQLVVTSQGRIFGINCRDSDLHIDPYLYEFTSEKVVKRGSLIKANRQSGFLFFNNYLYVIGGRGENNKVSEKNYKYSITERKWSQIANCNVGVRKPTLCTFENRFIFKLGGINEFDYICKTIEVYDTHTDKWSLVRASPRNVVDEVNILEDSLAVQVNKWSIYVFGGINRNGFKEDTGFVLTIIDISQENVKSNVKVTGQLINVNMGRRNLLSLFGILSSSNVVIHNCTIYCLRNAIST